MLEVNSGLVATAGVLVAIAALLETRKAHRWQYQKDQEERKRQEPPLEKGLRVLLHAYELTNQEKAGPWEFAVEASELRALGLYDSDFRLLVHKGFAEHAEAFTRPGCPGRGFQSRGDPTFAANICLILTGKGVEYARSLLASREKGYTFASCDKEVRNSGNRGVK